MSADAAEAQHGETAAAQLRRAEPLRADGSQGGEDAGGGVHRRVATAARGDRAAERVRSALRDGDHVVRAGADVRAGRISAIEGSDHIADVVQQVATFGRVEDMPRWQRYDGLAAAVGQPGEGGLVGHGDGEAQRVGESVAPVRVVRDPAATDGLSKSGGVHRDDDREAGPGAAPDDDVLVLHASGR